MTLTNKSKTNSYFKEVKSLSLRSCFCDHKVTLGQMNFDAGNLRLEV